MKGVTGRFAYVFGVDGAEARRRDFEIYPDQIRRMNLIRQTKKRITTLWICNLSGCISMRRDIRNGIATTLLGSKWTVPPFGMKLGRPELDRGGSWGRDSATWSNRKKVAAPSSSQVRRSLLVGLLIIFHFRV